MSSVVLLSAYKTDFYTESLRGYRWQTAPLQRDDKFLPWEATMTWQQWQCSLHLCIKYSWHFYFTTTHLHCDASSPVSLSLHFNFILQGPELWHEMSWFSKTTFFWLWMVGIICPVGSLYSHMLVSNGGRGWNNYTGAILNHIQNPILRIENKQNKKNPTWFSGILQINTELSPKVTRN